MLACFLDRRHASHHLSRHDLAAMYELRNKVSGLLRLLLRLLVLGISLCLASAGAVQAQPAVMTTEDLGTLFDQHALREMKKSNIAGAAIVVVKDGAVVFMRGYGYADV